MPTFETSSFFVSWLKLKSQHENPQTNNINTFICAPFLYV